MLDWLFKQFPSYQVLGSNAFKPTLENTRKILSLLNHPGKNLTFVHVAGSNGKGSVCSYLSSILTEAGYTVGLFTSPHIVDFTERIRTNGKCIPMQDVNEFIENIRSTNLDFNPSFFEITFGMALEHFKKKNCDICIIETGLGGRLDATNVIDPLLSVITTISLEHTDMLGDTLEKIAFEKAGIIKPNANVVIGAVQPELETIFETEARSKDVQFIYADASDTSFDHYFIAAYQKENFKTVLAALDQIELTGFSISDHHISNGIEAVRKNTGYSGRLQVINQSPLTIFDVSHNAQGIEVTLDTIKNIKQGELHIVYGTSADKDTSTILPFFPLDASYYFTEFSSSRTAKIDDLKNAFDQINLKSTHYYKNAQEALNNAKENSSESDTILIIGSFFLLSDFF
ncbi:bifunctional folylpolyglutamate synthase/dihydrofolate synthase [Crocinitomicaceae bacterium]|nr:bifunctional folylpolyglutamate synthase/dihydrofolate synthase [Crocinitomicaceae bacterium]